MIWARWALALSAVALLYLPGISPLRLLVRLALHQIDPGRVQLLIGLVAAQFATIALALVACFALNAAKVWSIWLARLSAVLLILFGIPWLLPSGLFVLYALHDQSAVGFGTSTPSNSKRLWWAPILGGAAFLAGVSLLTQYAPSWGLPPGSLQQWILLVLVCGEWIEVTVHEFGHTLAAWAVGFRVRSVCIGPLLIVNDAQKSAPPGMAMGAPPHAARWLRRMHSLRK